MSEYKAYGKLLISGEYLILHGSQGLALPLNQKFQSMKVFPMAQTKINWQAFDKDQKIWLETQTSLKELKNGSLDQQGPAGKIQSLLKYVYERAPKLFNTGLRFETQMNFSVDWGLGSSSTLISLISQWSGVDAFELQKEFFGGSGYDVACATAESPLIYELRGGSPHSKTVYWSPGFKENLFFVYLGQKQNSRESMTAFKRTTPIPSEESIKEVSRLTKDFVTCLDLKTFQKTMQLHETVISELVGLSPIKVRLFSDFPGEIKSLGAWGGDFVMVASQDNPESYFRSRGYELIFKWRDLVAPQ